MDKQDATPRILGKEVEKPDASLHDHIKYLQGSLSASEIMVAQLQAKTLEDDARIRNKDAKIRLLEDGLAEKNNLLKMQGRVIVMLKALVRSFGIDVNIQVSDIQMRGDASHPLQKPEPALTAKPPSNDECRNCPAAFIGICRGR